MSQIDINFNQEGGSSNDFLIGVLNKLNAAIDRLSAKSTRQDDSFNTDRSRNPFKQTAQDFKRAADEYSYAAEKAMKDLGSKMGSTIGGAIGAAIGVTVLRHFNNEANATMARASASGNFIASAIGGNANQAFGGYASSMFDIERQLRIANTNANAEGVGGGVGAVGGAALGAAIGMVLGGPPGALVGISQGALAGAAAGGGFGKYMAAEKSNQYTEQIMLAAGALAKRNANASVSQWETGFSRFGNGMTDTEIVPGAITGGSSIRAPLQTEFMNKYGKSQNFKAIQENIVPYLTTNPLDTKAGDLDRLAQQFTKAGFSVGQFSQLTMQAAQSSAISGKEINSFGDDIIQARTKFGYGYGADTNQTALNLMTAGFDKEKAQSLAYQAQFNPGISGNVSKLSHSSYGEFYRLKALSPILGYDVPGSLSAGHMIGATDATKAQYKKDLANLQSGKSLSVLLGLNNSNGIDIASLIQNKVAEGKGLTAEELKKGPGNGPGQNAAYTVGTVEGLLAKVGTMNVTATMVTLINTGPSMPHATDIDKNAHGKQMAGAPVTGAPSYSPTKH